MKPASGEMSSQKQWDEEWRSPVDMQLPSKFSVSARDTARFLRRHVKPNSKFLEIGFAPGKTLAWVAHDLGSEVAGIDYSEVGVAQAKRLFDALKLKGDLRCENIFSHSFASQQFDCVFSNGVIEHFEEPINIVNIHCELLKPGGKAVILIPNFRGIYGRLMDLCNPSYRETHNLAIMDVKYLAKLCPDGCKATAFPWGRVSPWLRSAPDRNARMFKLLEAINLICLLQPFDIPFLCPRLALVIEKDSAHGR